MNGLLTFDTPLELILRGKIPSLKNNRILKQNDKTGKIQSLPQTEVVKAIANIKAAVGRQLPKELTGRGYPLLASPVEVYMIIHLGVYYKSDLPASDVDNACTTIQEALQGIIYEEDNQVKGTSQRRIQFQTDLTLYTRVWVWIAEEKSFFEKEVIDILDRSIRRLF